MFVCVTIEITGSSVSEVLVILWYGWNSEKYDIHIFQEQSFGSAVCRLSTFEKIKLENHDMQARGCFLWRTLTSRSKSTLWKRTWNVTLVTRVIVDQQLWISMNSWNTKLYVFNAHSVALIFQCWQCSSNFSTAATLSFHMKTVHEGQNIQCNICDNKMPAKGSLEAPLRSKHEEIEL